jgi:hypothetical protein
MRQATTAELRLDHGKAASFGAARPTRPPFWLLPVGCEQISLPRGSQGRRIRSDKPGIRRIWAKMSSTSRTRWHQALPESSNRHCRLRRWPVRPTHDLTAYDLYLRGYAMVSSSLKQTSDALRLMEQAIVRGPRYGPALAWAAFCCHRLVQDDRSKDRDGDRLKGTDFARRALEVAGDDPAVVATAAHALAFFGEDIGAMMALVDRALALNPNYARGWYISAALRTAPKRC